MRPVIFVLFALLISGCYSSDVDPNDESNKVEPSDVPLPHEEDTNELELPEEVPPYTGMSLIELDESALYLIIKELNFRDTLVMADLHPILSEVANEVFKDKKPSYELRVTGHSPILNRPTRDYDFIMSGPIRVDDITRALSIIRHFGSSIEKITIDYTIIKRQDRKTISKYLREYAAKSVKVLKLHPINQSILNELSSPLKELEDLSVAFHSRLPGSSRRWNKLFPKLKRFSFTTYSKSKFNLINCEFPQLSHLTLRINKDSWNIIENAKTLIEKHSNIESLELGEFYTPDFAETVVEHMSKLTQLTLHSWNFGGEKTTTFSNLKNLILRTSNVKTPDTMVAPVLETLEMHFFPDQAEKEKWTTFFNAHTHLTRLRLIESFTSHALPLNDFTANLQNLENVTFLYTTEISIDDIITFIDTHAKLEKFQFAHQVLDNKFETDAQKLREKYGNDWEIKDFGYVGNKGLHFQKKSAASAK